MTEPLWIFAYGSLIWRPDIEYAESAMAAVHGYRRSFAQRSTDHRGRPDAPGRVVTLLAEPGAVCQGLAFRIEQALRAEVLAALDQRESGGYVREAVTLRLHGGRRVPGLVYVARPDNPNHVGEAPLDALARQIHHAEGPSGSNRQYVLELARALRELGIDEPHIFELERRLLELSTTPPAAPPT